MSFKPLDVFVFALFYRNANYLYFVLYKFGILRIDRFPWWPAKVFTAI